MSETPKAPSSIRRVAIASFIGTTIEWYDFFLYGTASALIFGKLFFPKLEPLSGTLAAFGTYAVGFVARPIGGIVCGHYGDRIGRKSMLVFTLLLMGVATFLIGLLPTYQSIGVWAPVLLVALRFAQGFGIGGEWGGAVLMAVEHSPPGRRGFYGSWPQIGVPAGLLLATLVFRLLEKLPEEQFLGWGWRLGFLASIVMVAVGLFIRLAIVEPPVFEQIKERSSAPILDALRQHPKGVCLAMGARLAENGAFYLFTTFVIIYATQARIGFSKAQVLTAVSIAAAIELIAIPAYGALSDRIGRRPVYLFGAVVTGLFAFPYFWLLDAARPGYLLLAVLIPLIFGHAAMYAPQASFFSELFGTKVRYSGASLGYQLASVIAGGLSPIIAVDLLKRTGAGWPIALLVVAMSAVTVVSVWLAAETAHHDIASRD